MNNQKQLDVDKLRVELQKIAEDVIHEVSNRQFWSENRKLVDINIWRFTDELFNVVETLIGDGADKGWFSVTVSDSVSIRLLAVWGEDAFDFQVNGYDETCDGSDVCSVGINKHYTIQKSDIYKRGDSNE